VHRAFQLRESGPPRLDPLGEKLTQGWRNSIGPMAASLGLVMKQPTRLPLTRLAHEAAAWARARGAFAPFHEALFRAFFVDDLDIGDPAVLKTVAFRAGLNDADLDAALGERRMADEVDEDRLIAQTYGITSVPTFVIGGHLLRGVQEEATLIRAIELAETGKLDEETRRLPHLPITISRAP
jgi:predicted DsbA family dithiol-disulfide isomerase